MNNLFSNIPIFMRRRNSLPEGSKDNPLNPLLQQNTLTSDKKGLLQRIPSFSYSPAIKHHNSTRSMKKTLHRKSSKSTLNSTTINANFTISSGRESSRNSVISTPDTPDSCGSEGYVSFPNYEYFDANLFLDDDQTYLLNKNFGGVDMERYDEMFVGDAKIEY
ncbi:1084_t:CDS:1 [Ambispora gerdemannii]|uniref:1084_t:CDS:1 n=1 Tax=Ambispora gerdemannii TaxID=144530 RepID=A0A9N9BV47_9GLOM|nr:1084_t:CDS:1 [Ambispora gerdemannii]